MRQEPRKVACLTAALGVLLAAAVGVSGCSPGPPGSVLNGARLVCRPGSRKCLAVGTVRWSQPVGGSYSFIQADETGEAVLDLPGASSDGVASFDLSPDTTPDIALGDGVAVWQRDGVVTAADLATGRVRWRTRLPQPPVPAGERADTTDLTASLVIADGMVGVHAIADGSGGSLDLWWLVNVATGVTSPPRAEPVNAGTRAPLDLEVIPAGHGAAVLLLPGALEAIDASSGRRLWRTSWRAPGGTTVSGATLYGGMRNAGGRLTGIQRIDLATGRALRELPIPADAAGRYSSLTSSNDIDGGGAQPAALLLSGERTLARVDPGTGRVLWQQRLPSAINGGLHTDPESNPPGLDYLLTPPPSVAVPAPSNNFARPVPGVGKDIFRIQTVSLSTGHRTSITLGPRFPYAAADIAARGQPSVFKLDGPVLLAVAGRAGANGFRYVRLEGVDPSTGRTLWRGPWAGDLYVLAVTPTAVIAASCAPAGVQGSAGDVQCTSPRLYAINA